VVFRPLDRDAMRQIVARELNQLLEREGITRRNLLVEIDEDVNDLLLETGFSPVYGARPLKREIEQRIIVPLARYLVAHRITGSQLIQVKRDGNQVQLSSTTLSAAKQKVKLASPLPSADDKGTERKMDLKELVDGIATVRLRLDRWVESDTVREMKIETNKLLACTRQSGFVNYGVEAHKTWGRIYHLDRLTQRLGQLKDRAQYLEEFAILTHRQRDQRYQPELAQRYTDLCRDVDYLEIELLCAHLKESGQALLYLKPRGRSVPDAGMEERGDTADVSVSPRPRVPTSPQAWLLTLAKMYLRWAMRKGYEYEVFVPTGDYKRWIDEQGFSVKAYIPNLEVGPPLKPPWTEVKVDDFATLVRRLEALDPSELAVSVKGPYIYGFLKSEAGAHKLLIRSKDIDATARVQVVSVQVETLDEDTSAHEYLNRTMAERPQTAEGGQQKAKIPEVIRIYAPDCDRYVRDLRTEVRTTRVDEMFEGDLDEFILAYLKTEEAGVAWQEE
jgi:protein subunit release factor B